LKRIIRIAVFRVNLQKPPAHAMPPNQVLKTIKKSSMNEEYRLFLCDVTDGADAADGEEINI